jgi:hypothetical protein
MKTKPCESCQAPIVWAKTPTGARMPVNPAPDATGNIVLSDGPKPGDPPLAVVTHMSQALDRPRYKSHFATCPNAKLHRKGTGK